MRLLYFSIVFGICCVFLGCEKQEKTQQNTTLEPKRITHTTLEANNGEKLTFKNVLTQNALPKDAFKDLQVISENANIKILVFFTTWCDPCRGILPHLENLSNQFGDSIAFFLIPVDDLVGEVENFKGTLQVFSEKNMLNLPLIADAKRAQLFQMLNGLEGVPLIVLYDAKGAYVAHYLGAIPEEMLEFDLTQLIKGQ